MTVWHGLSDLGVGVLRERRLAPSAKSLQCSGALKINVLSAWLCCGIGICCTLVVFGVWMVPVHGGVWSLTGFRPGWGPGRCLALAGR